MDALAIYLGSDGKQTMALYARLEALGPMGVVAMNVFRAQKCSERAKSYSRRYRNEAYGRKTWSMGLLATAMAGTAMPWGWKEDPTQEFHRWVLYVELPTGQVSFHTDTRGQGPDYAGEWDQQRGVAAVRVCKWVQTLLDAAPVA